MTVTLLPENQTWSDIRVLVRETFGAGALSSQGTSGSDWLLLPMQRRGQRKHGFEVLRFSRGALPFVGRAVLKLEYGNFADGLIAADADSTARQRTGSPWSYTTDGLAIQDLRGYEIRIQGCEKDSEAWATLWWGQCEYQEDSGAPGAAIPMGTRLFHCVDGLQRANRWMMTIHGYTNNYDGSQVYPAAVGAMGYNTPIDQDARVSKNRDSSQWQTDGGAQVFYHCAPGVGNSNYWTAQQAAEHALALVRPSGEPLFTFAGYAGNAAILALLGGIYAWSVKDSDSALAILLNICKRERGRGVVFVDWDDDTSAPTGPLSVKLTIAPQLLANLIYTTDAVGQTTASLIGASTALTTTTVDLIGDHRNDAGSFRLGDPYQFRFDYLETVSEPIEVLATLSYLDGQVNAGSSYFKGAAIAPRWTATEQSSFRSASAAARAQPARYKAVYQAHGLRPNWYGLAGNGDGGTQDRIDYRCDDNGVVVVPNPADRTTSPGLVKILPDLPLYQGYDYSTSTPARFDGLTEQTPPTRRRLFGGVRVAASRFMDFDNPSSTISLEFRLAGHNELWLSNSDDEAAGTRIISDATASLGAASAPIGNYQNLFVTVGLRLPHRVRFASGNPTKRKRGRVELKDYHLWLASPGAIWDIDTTTGTGGTAGNAARRNAAGATGAIPGLLRDDRNALALIHAQLWAWYGTDTSRRSCSWTLKACGVLPSFDAVTTAHASSADTPTTITYPKLGQLVTDLSANGETQAINTPITLVEYDNLTGTTSWSTEWSELEVE